MTTIRTLIAAALISSIALTGCADDDLSGSFSSATSEERRASIDTAIGLPVVLATLNVIFADFSADSDECLSREADGDTVTFSGVDCAAGDAATFKGSAVVQGWSDFQDEDDADRIIMTLDRFAMRDDNGGYVQVSGIVDVEQNDDGSGTTNIDLVVDAGGKEFGLAATLVCDAAPTPCRYEDASGMVSGLGSFAIEGTYRQGKGVLVLIAGERMVVDFDAVADDCAPVTIDGQPAPDHCKPVADGSDAQ